MNQTNQPPTEHQSINYELWEHLHDEHGLTLLESDLIEIIRIAQKTPVTEERKVICRKCRIKQKEQPNQ